jgi:hypothetical protein
MISKSFSAWLDRNQYAWYPQFEDVEEISSFIWKHTSRGTRIGKVLTKMKLEDCDSFTIQQGVLAWNATQYIPNIEIVDDVTTIQDAYTQVYSCMTKSADDMATFLSHPLLIEQGVRVAVYRHNGHITGRCIVNMHKHSMLSLYTNGNMLEFQIGMEELGFMNVQESCNRVLSDKMLPLTGFLPYLDEFGGHCHFAKDPSKEWCFGWPEGACTKEAILGHITKRIEIGGFDVNMDTLMICTDTELGQWKLLTDVIDELNNAVEN